MVCNLVTKIFSSEYQIKINERESLLNILVVFHMAPNPFAILIIGYILEFNNSFVIVMKYIVVLGDRDGHKQDSGETKKDGF